MRNFILAMALLALPLEVYAQSSSDTQVNRWVFLIEKILIILLLFLVIKFLLIPLIRSIIKSIETTRAVNAGITHEDWKKNREKKEQKKKEDKRIYNHVSNHVHKGNKLFLKKRYEDAIFEYSKAIELNPNIDILYYNRSIAYGKIDLYEKAVADYDKALKLNPNNHKAHKSRGEFEMGSKFYDQALAGFRVAIASNPRIEDELKPIIDEIERKIRNDGDGEK